MNELLRQRILAWVLVMVGNALYMQVPEARETPYGPVVITVRPVAIP